MKKILFIIFITSQSAFATAKQIEFEKTLQSARDYFKPIYQSKGKELSILGEWEYDENNGKALAYTVDHYFIEIYGGALKSKGTNTDSLRAMICHEVGHHLGGSPFMPKYYEDYYLFRGSSEGQADYYAANLCLKKWFHGEDHWKVNYLFGFSKKDQAFCEDYYQHSDSVGLCVRIISAMKRMLSIDIETHSPLNLKNPKSDYLYALAPSVTHPKKNCRLETVYAGVICQTESGCLINQNPIEASRPLCWAGIGFLLENEYQENQKETLDFINNLPIKKFHKDFYDDDEVHRMSLILKSKYSQLIPSLELYF